MRYKKYVGTWTAIVFFTDYAGETIGKRKMNFKTKKEALIWNVETLKNFIDKNTSNLTLKELIQLFLVEYTANMKKIYKREI